MVTYQEWKAKKAENSQKNTEPKVVNKRAASIKQGYEDWKKRKAEQGDLLTSQQRNERNSFQESWGDVSRRFANYMADSENFFANAPKNYFANNQDRTVQDLQSEGIDLLNWVNKYGLYLDENTRRDISKYLREMDVAYSDAIKLFSNFSGYDDYIKWDAYSTTENRQKRYEQNQKRLSELEAEKIKVQNNMTTYQPGTNPYTYGGYSVSGAGYGAAAQNFASGNSGPQAEKLNALNDEINSIKREMTMYERGGTDADTGFYYGSKVVDDYSAYLNDPNYGQFSAEDFRNPTKDDLRYYDAMMDQSTWYKDNSGNTRNRMGDIVTEYVNADDPRYQIADPLGVYLQANPEDISNMHGDGSTQLGVLNQLLMDGYYGSWDQLDEREREIYYTLLGTQGKEAAMKYLSDMETELNRRNMAQESELYKLAFERANGWQRLGMSAVSIPANLLGGATAFVDDLSHMVRGEDINPYSAAHHMQNYGQQVRANQAAAFDESSGWEIPGIGFSAGDLYQAAMSTADMFGGAMIGPTAYGALMGMGAASSEARRLYEMGASKDQIFWGSAAAGAAELVFEKFSIEKLIDIKDADTLGKLVLNALKQGGIEASEEGATELANLITNNLIMTSESDWAKLIEANNGDVGAATWAAIGQIGAAAAGGFVSGFMGGTGSSAVNYAQNYRNDVQQGAAIREGNGVNPLRDLAMTMAEKETGKAQAALQKQSDRLGKDYLFEFTKDRDAGRLYRTVQNTASESNKADVANALQQQGYSQKEARKIADAFYTQAIGMEVSKDQQKVISKYGSDEKVQKVIGDLRLSSESSIAKRNQIIKKPEETTDEKFDPEANDASEEIDDSEPSYDVSEDGQTHMISNPQQTVNLSGFASTKDGKVMLRTDTGETVAADDVSYGSESEALIYEAIASLGAPVSNANALLQAYKGKNDTDAEIFARGIQEAFEYGQLGIPMAEMADSAFASKLSKFQMEYVYRLGKKSSGKKIARKLAAIREKAKNAEGGKRTGTLHFDRKGRKFSDIQETSLKTLEQMAAGLGIDFYVYESYENASGNRVYINDQGKEVEAPNGFYVSNDGSVHIDLNAGQDGQGIILFTASHELVHFIKQWSPAKFKVLANFLVEQYHQKDVSVKDLIQQQMDKAQRTGRELTFEEAYEEMVADSMETMLADGNVVQMMAELKQRDKTLWRKICDWFRDLVADLQQMVDAYKGVKPETAEGRMVADMKDAITVFQALYTDALYDASESFQTAKNTTGEGGVAGGYEIKLSDREETKFKQFAKEIDSVVNLSISGKGNIDGKAQIKDIMPTGPKITAMVAASSGNMIDISERNIALSTSDIWHEFKRHTSVDAEISRGQIAFTKRQFQNAVKCIISPDIVETIFFDANNPTQKQSFAYAKKTSRGNYVVVEAVGGKKNPHIYPVVILQFSKAKWNNMISQGKTLGEILFENDPKKLQALDIKRNKESRVTAAQFASYEAIANTLRSPQLTSTVAQTDPAVNKKFSDRDYMDAVNRGDMRTAQKMVDDAAKQWGAFLNNTDANEVFKQNGEVRTFYHGTNTGDFTVFDKSLFGNSSGDMGWFGKGFYFAFSSKEAATYGGRVINAYLKMRKPYDYSQLYKFKGSDYVSDRYSRFAWLYNIVNQFPDIVSGQKVYAYPNDTENGTVVSWKQLAGWMERIPQEAKFSVEQVDTPYGDIAWELRANPKQESFTNGDGETFTWTEYGMRVLFLNERDAREPINQIGAYLSEVMGVETIPRRSIEKIDFSGAVQKAGYDGILQSPSGDEAVVFDASQIKSSDPVTYDDNGKVIPLSKRFDIKNPDIRYSSRNKAAKDVNAAIQKENAQLKEDVQQLKELLKLQRTVTGGTKFTKSSVESMAGILMQNNNAKGDRKELARMLNDLYEFIATNKELSWEAVADQAQPAVDWIRRNVVVKKELSQYAKDILHTLRTSRISLNETQKGEAAYRYGSVNDYRKSMMGSVVIANDGVPLDIQWQEWASTYPDIFDADISDSDMPGALADVISSLRNSDLSVAEYAYHADMIEQDILRQVYDSYWRVSTLRTVADVKQREINLLKGKHYQKMNELRQKHQEASEKMKQAQRDRIKKLRQEYRDSADKKIQAIKDKNEASRKRVAEFHAKKDATAKLMKLILDTSEWVAGKDKNGVKVPDAIKVPYAEFLKAIELPSSKQVSEGGDPTQRDLRIAKSMTKLVNTIERIKNSQDPSKESKDNFDADYLDLPADFVQKFRDLTDTVTELMTSTNYVVNGLNVGSRYVVDNMSASEVKQLSKLLETFNHAIKEAGKLYNKGRFANAAELGKESMGFMDALGEIEKTSGVAEFVEWDNALPFYAFKRFGDGGKSVFEGFMDAQDKLAFLAKDIFDFQEKTWKPEDVKKWSEDVHIITTSAGSKLTLTTADAMTIYCLSRRKQGLQHLLGGGVRVVGIKKGSTKAKDTRSVLTQEDIDAIETSLTDRQKKVAEDLQRFMSTTCAKWGNEISMKRFLTREFTEENYFPIESNDENMTTRDPSAQQSDLFRLLNISATKELNPNANNEVIIRNVFDVFIGHATDMAKLNAYAMPLLDYMKWLNYRERTETEEGQVIVKGVRKSMETAYGNAAKNYVLNLVKDVNGRVSDGGDPSILMKWMRNAKTASVGASGRVALLQITSYPRAALVLSPKSLALGLRKLPRIEKAKKYCGIALWKSFGFYDTNIARSIEDQLKGTTNYRQKLIELSLKGAEWADAITWGALWNACEYEVAAFKKYEVGTETFNRAVADKLREVVYQTQVVDSVLTRSQIMRRKSGWAQEFSSYMSEPTLSANILMDAAFEFNMEKRRTGNAKAAWQKTGAYVGRALAVYSVGQLVSALFEGFSDAWRDDDDEEFWSKKFPDAFKKNLVFDLMPFNKIPIVSDVFEAVLAMLGKGYFSSDSLPTTGLMQAVKATDAWRKALDDNNSTTVYNATYNTVKALSTMSGVSFSGAMREIVDVWNITAGSVDTTLKIRQYRLTKDELGNELYEAITSGDTKQANSLENQFEDEAAVHTALRKALRSNDPRIREAAEYLNSDDYSSYLDIVEEIMDEGHFDRDDVIKAIRSEASALAPEEGSGVSKAQSLMTAEQFAIAVANGDNNVAKIAMDDIIATAQENGKTESEAVDSFHSSAKSALKDQYLVDTLSGTDAEKALVAYCGMDAEEAAAAVRKWEFESESGFAYGSMRQEFLDKHITAAQARDALITYGGETGDDADDIIEGWQFESQYGFAWENRAKEYKDENITRNELRTALMKKGGMTSEEADIQIQVYDWEMEGYNGASFARVRDYNAYCSAQRVPIDIYLYIRKFASNTENDVVNGKAVSGTAVKKIMAEINAQRGLTPAQKTALAKSIGWKDSTIRKYKLW